MPYKSDACGLYKIVNEVTKQCYVGQSRRVRKRLREHFRLLKLGKHTNRHLQSAYDQYGASVFRGEIEVECESLEELSRLECAFERGAVWFDDAGVMLISQRKHTAEARERIKLGRRAATFDYRSAAYRATLSKAQMARFHSDPKFVAKLRFILENPEMSYAERARRLGSDTSSVRRLALKYHHLKGAL